MYSLARVTEVMAKRGRLHVTDLIEIASRAERIASDADAIVKLDPSRHLLPEAEANAAEHERNKTTPSASGPPCGGRETDFPSDEEIEHLHNCKIVPGVLPEDAPDWLRVVEKHDRYAGALKVLFDLRKKRPHVPSIRGERKLALRHDDIVVDLGAFVGTFAARCKAFPVKAVRVYEPAPIAAAVCRANGVETIEAAVVGDNSRRVIDFEVSMTGLGCTSALRGYGTERRSFRSIQVPTVSYAEAVKGATVVKVDVEGAEYDYPLVQPSIRAVLLDFHQHATDWRAKAQVMIDDLRAHGFEAIVPPRLDAGKDHLLGSLWIRE